MIQHRTYLFLVFYYVFFLILADESFKHDLHGVKLSIPQTSHEIDFAKSSNSQTLTDLVLLQPSFCNVLQTVETRLPIEYALSDRDLIIKKDILIYRLESYDLRSF